MSPQAAKTPLSTPTLGVDTGGTFTDLAWLTPDGRTVSGKVHSTPLNPAQAILDGIRQTEHSGTTNLDELEIVHGTTVALNALLTGQVAKTALVVNRGFRDLIEIGRQERSDIYSLEPEKPRSLVDRELRFELNQRSWPDAEGNIREIEAPTRAQLAKLLRSLERSGAESIAICLLHSYADPAIETQVARALERAGLPISCSASILPAHREFERFSTAVANACVAPIMSAYLDLLAKNMPGRGLSILQSSGRTLTAERAAREPVRVLFSGPAGGVMGASRAAWRGRG